ncbi:MAG: alpha/beta fold hydrolase [Bacteriovoracaceae bacterium]|nr:alpha/beta fold hydrolase [Bacteriovoracaceae bacterium]
MASLYPFKSNFLKIGDQRYHYLDEGQGEVILMLHGNPTWSFYYRNLVRTLKKDYRIIVPDHMGCGLSDKPQEYAYTLDTHISNLLVLIHKLQLTQVNLMVHDWGGAIGFGLATKRPELIKKIMIMNTAAFLSPHIPRRIAFCRTKIGAFLVQAMNAFAWPATFMTTTKPMTSLVKEGYLLPYDSFANRIAVRRFVEDIPMTPKDQSYETILDIESKLPLLDMPKLILWGGADFCFNDKFYKKWLEIYPEAEAHYFKDVGHYVLEDALTECLPLIKKFLRG